MTLNLIISGGQYFILQSQALDFVSWVGHLPGKNKVKKLVVECPLHVRCSRVSSLVLQGIQFLSSSFVFPLYLKKPFSSSCALASLVSSLHSQAMSLSRPRMYIPVPTAYVIGFHGSVWLRDLDLSKMSSCLPCLTSCVMGLKSSCALQLSFGRLSLRAVS